MEPVAEALKLVALIYEGVEQPTVWIELLDRLGKSLSGPAAINIYEPSCKRGKVLAGTGYDPAVLKSYDEYYGQVNYYIQRAGPQMHTGWVVSSDQLCTDAEVKKTEYYDGFLRPFDLFYMLGSVISQSTSLIAFLTSYRPHGRGPFEAHDHKLMELLMPHLQRAVRLDQHLSVLRGKAKALDALTIGVVATTGSGQVVFTNSEADKIIARQDGLIFDRHGRLRAGPTQTSSLHALISHASQAAMGNSLHVGGTLLLERPSGKRSYVVCVCPYRPHTSELAQLHPRVLIFVIDPETQPASDIKALSRVFGLTPSEARLAVILAQGESLAEASQRLRISRNTARTHLQHLFQKMGVRRQAELATLLLRCTGQLRIDS
jgi:DNA-binding CsgD family transcriptional regulator